MPGEPRTPIGRAADAAGRAIGAAAEQHFRRRHVSRLRRTGHLSAQAPIGALGAGGFGVREGNDVRVLIDGEDAFAAMASAIEGARRTIHLTSWSADPAFAMSRADPRRTLGALLAGAGERGVRTRVLLWRGAPLPVIHPSRADNAAAARGFNAIDGVTCALDAHEYLLDCHHEKLLIVDDEIAFVGGLDLTALRSDRWDTTGHPPRDSDGWHDAAVRATGPVVADVVAHFGQRWGEVTGERLPASAVPEAMGTIAARLIRTIPERVYRFAPDGDLGRSAPTWTSSARRSGSSTWRTSSCGRRRSSTSSRRSCGGRRATTSGSSSCCPTTPTPARTRRSASSAASATRTPGVGCSP